MQSKLRLNGKKWKKFFLSHNYKLIDPNNSSATSDRKLILLRKRKIFSDQKIEEYLHCQIKIN